jgi:Xaa-Pro aminopeptidase
MRRSKGSPSRERTHPGVLNMTAPPQVYQQRRARLAEELLRPLVIFAGHAPARNYATNPHRFRAASTYLYFGGPPIEHAALVIEPGSDGDVGCTLIRPQPGPEDIVWVGAPPQDADLAYVAGLAPRRLVDPKWLEQWAARRKAAAIVPPCLQTQSWAAQLGLETPTEDEVRAIIDLRLTKDEYELRAMRRAAAISIEAHRAALAATRPGTTEAQIAAAYTAVVVSHEADHAFNPIITVRGEVLHAEGHHRKLVRGNLLLVDAGAEEPTGYASDLTRTVPVDGRFSPVQRHFYQTVKRALDAAIAACVPGRRYRDVHDLAATVICEGLVQAELLRGDPAELVARAAHALFFVHGVGHLIGLDVHDMEDFGDLAGYAPGRTRRPQFGNKFLRLDRDLAPGMTVTIEPGIYFIPQVFQTPSISGPYRDVLNRRKLSALLKDGFGGIRLEQTICVRPRGKPEILTADLPTDPDALSALVGGK